MAPSAPVTVRVRETADYAQLAPYLVGFTPTESLVIFAIQNNRVQVTARADLAEMAHPGAVEDILARIWRRFPNARAAMVAYTADHPRGWNILRRGERWLPTNRPHQSLLVDGDTWQLRDGTTGSIDHNGRIAAQAVYAGLVPLSSRAEIEARFSSPPDSDDLDQQFERAVADLPDPDDKAAVVALTKTLLDRHLSTTPADQDARIPALEAIQLAVLVQHPDARATTLVSIDRDNASQHLHLWQNVVTESPAHGADMALYLAGMAAWVAGEGASANIALDRVLADESRLDRGSPARLLHDLIENVVPPTHWESLRRSLYADADPLVRQALADRSASRSGWEPTPDLPTAPARSEQTRRRPPAPGLTI